MDDDVPDSVPFFFCFTLLPLLMEDSTNFLPFSGRVRVEDFSFSARLAASSRVLGARACTPSRFLGLRNSSYIFTIIYLKKYKRHLDTEKVVHVSIHACQIC